MRRYQDDFTPKMKDFKVLLLGSYDECCLDRLCLLRLQLQSKGYNNTKMVRDLTAPTEIEELDFTDNERYPYEKSMFGIEWSNIAIFVFFKCCTFDSVITEMHESIESYGKKDCVEFLIEDEADFRDVNKGYLRRHEIRRKIFSNEDDLYSTAKSKCWNHIVTGKC